MASQPKIGGLYQLDIIPGWVRTVSTISPNGGRRTEGIPVFDIKTDRFIRILKKRDTFVYLSVWSEKLDLILFEETKGYIDKDVFRGCRKIV